MLAPRRRLEQSGADALLLLARALLAWLFLHEGYVLAANLDGTFGAMGKLGVPSPLALATIALQLGAGAGLLLGFQTRLTALGLGLFCLATALLFHTNVSSRNELLHFEKDLAIAGGMLGLIVCGPGRWSLGALFRTGRSRRAVEPGTNPPSEATAS